MRYKSSYQMKLFTILFAAILPFMVHAEGVEATHIINPGNGTEAYSVVSKVMHLDEVTFARINIEVPTSAQLTGLEANAHPVEKTATGYIIYLYKTPENNEISFSYLLASTTPSNVTFSIHYSDDNERFFKSLTGLEVSTSGVKTIDANNDATLITPTIETLVSKRKLNENEVFSVQVLALTAYDEAALKQFCKNNGISRSNLIKREVGRLTKFSVGEYETWQEALKKLESVKAKTGLTDLFLTRITK